MPAEGLETFLIILTSLPVLLHPQSNKRKKRKTENFPIPSKKKNKQTKKQNNKTKKISQRSCFQNIIHK